MVRYWFGSLIGIWVELLDDAVSLRFAAGHTCGNILIQAQTVGKSSNVGIACSHRIDHWQTVGCQRIELPAVPSQAAGFAQHGNGTAAALAHGLLQKVPDIVVILI